MATEKATGQAPGELIDIGGRRLHLLRYMARGKTRPEKVTIVLDGGLGQTGLIWSLALPALRRLVDEGAAANVVAYDRAGYGWSEPDPQPRSGARVVADLRALLACAGIVGPYILVGHSWSGITMRLFASQRPSEVAGLVLVDSFNPELFLADRALFRRYLARLGAVFRNAALAGRLGALRPVIALRPGILPEFITKQPVEIRSQVIATYLNGNAFATAAAENRCVEASAAQALQAPLPADLPIVALTHGRPTMFVSLPEREAIHAETIWQETQSHIANNAARGRLMIASQSGHDIHVDEPELISEAVRWALNWRA